MDGMMNLGIALARLRSFGGTEQGEELNSIRNPVPDSHPRDNSHPLTKQSHSSRLRCVPRLHFLNVRIGRRLMMKFRVRTERICRFFVPSIDFVSRFVRFHPVGSFGEGRRPFAQITNTRSESDEQTNILTYVMQRCQSRRVFSPPYKNSKRATPARATSASMVLQK